MLSYVWMPILNSIVVVSCLLLTLGISDGAGSIFTRIFRTVAGLISWELVGMFSAVLVMKYISLLILTIPSLVTRFAILRRQPQSGSSAFLLAAASFGAGAAAHYLLFEPLLDTGASALNLMEQLPQYSTLLCGFFSSMTIIRCGAVAPRRRWFNEDEEAPARRPAPPVRTGPPPRLTFSDDHSGGGHSLGNTQGFQGAQAFRPDTPPEGLDGAIIRGSAHFGSTPAQQPEVPADTSASAYAEKMPPADSGASVRDDPAVSAGTAAPFQAPAPPAPTANLVPPPVKTMAAEPEAPGRDTDGPFSHERQKEQFGLLLEKMHADENEDDKHDTLRTLEDLLSATLPRSPEREPQPDMEAVSPQPGNIPAETAPAAAEEASAQADAPEEHEETATAKESAAAEEASAPAHASEEREETVKVKESVAAEEAGAPADSPEEHEETAKVKESVAAEEASAPADASEEHGETTEVKENAAASPQPAAKRKSRAKPRKRAKPKENSEGARPSEDTPAEREDTSLPAGGADEADANACLICGSPGTQEFMLLQGGARIHRICYEEALASLAQLKSEEEAMAFFDQSPGLFRALYLAGVLVPREDDSQ